MSVTDIALSLSEGKRLRVTIRSGHLGCADAQDACDEFGYLLLYRHGEQYRIDDPEGENIVCVEDFNYIKSIIDSVID